MNNTNLKDYSDSYNQYLSFLDLELDPEWNKAWREQDEKKIEALLYKYGADISFGWEVEVCLHRPRTSKAVEYGPRFNFVSRTDKAWQPYMSTEELIAATSDKHLKAELIGMSRQSNFSGAAIEEYGVADKGEDV